MKINRYILYFLLSILMVVLAGCGGSEPETAALESSNSSIEPPAEYAGKSIPNNSDPIAGEETFQIYCASCHGERGLGDGVAAASLDPHPQNLAENQKNLSDAYLFWRIAEGGMMEPFSSAMPSWKGILSDDQIWNIVSFIRTLSG